MCLINTGISSFMGHLSGAYSELMLDPRFHEMSWPKLRRKFGMHVLYETLVDIAEYFFCP
jgi:hypothetical protein